MTVNISNPESVNFTTPEGLSLDEARRMRQERMDLILLTALEAGEIPDDDGQGLRLSQRDRDMVEAAVTILNESYSDTQQKPKVGHGLASLISKKSISLDSRIKPGQQPPDALPPRKTIAEALEVAVGGREDKLRLSIADVLVAGVSEQQPKSYMRRTIDAGGKAVGKLTGIKRPEDEADIRVRTATNRLVAKLFGPWARQHKGNDNNEQIAQANPGKAPLLLYAAVNRVGDAICQYFEPDKLRQTLLKAGYTEGEVDTKIAEFSSRNAELAKDEQHKPGKKAAVASARLFMQAMDTNQAHRSLYPRQLLDLESKISKAVNVTREEIVKIANKFGGSLEDAGKYLKNLKIKTSADAVTQAVEDHAQEEAERKRREREQRREQARKAVLNQQRKQHRGPDLLSTSGDHNANLVQETGAISAKADEAAQMGHDARLLDLQMALLEKAEAGDAKAQAEYQRIKASYGPHLVEHLHQYRDEIENGDIAPTEALFICNLKPDDFPDDRELREQVRALQLALRRGVFAGRGAGVGGSDPRDIVQKYGNDPEIDTIQALFVDDLLGKGARLTGLSSEQEATLNAIKANRAQNLAATAQDIQGLRKGRLLVTLDPRSRDRLLAAEQQLKDAQKVQKRHSMWWRVSDPTPTSEQ